MTTVYTENVECPVCRASTAHSDVDIHTKPELVPIKPNNKWNRKDYGAGRPSPAYHPTYPI